MPNSLIDDVLQTQFGTSQSRKYWFYSHRAQMLQQNPKLFEHVFSRPGRYLIWPLSSIRLSLGLTKAHRRCAPRVWVCVCMRTRLYSVSWFVGDYVCTSAFTWFFYFWSLRYVCVCIGCLNSPQFSLLMLAAAACEACTNYHESKRLAG